MKFSELGSWAVLAAVASARCFRPPITSSVSSVAAKSSSIPSSEIPASSAVASSEILPSSAVASSEILPSSSVASSAVVSSSVVSSLIASSSVPSSSILSSSVISSSIAPSSTPVSSSSTVVETCGGYQCFAAITAEPTIGESFCSSWLSQTPETTVVTETAVVTSTATSLETITTLLTQTTATTTKIVGSTTQFLKKRVVASSVVPSISSAPAPSETILGQCASNDERVSSACSCYLSTTSTVTVTETSTSTVVAEVASTVIETSTTKVIATVEALATQTVPAQPVLNPAFEGYLTTGTINPWVIGTSGQVQVINGVNPCTNINGVVQCSGGQVVIRSYPPTTGLKYSSISQVFLAKPSRTYGLSFVYRCLNYDAGTKIEVWYNGQLRGSTNNCLNSAAFVRPTSPIQFTTDATGQGTLEIRFVNSGATPYLYFYADDFQATLI